MTFLTLFLAVLLANLISFSLFLLLLCWLLPKFLEWQANKAKAKINQQIKNWWTKITNPFA